ncbi:TPA: DUF1482 family protein [Klebsiella oxytoca]
METWDSNKMTTWFALVLNICSLSGDCSEVVADIFDSEQKCIIAVWEDSSRGHCVPAKQVLTADDQRPAVRF